MPRNDGEMLNEDVVNDEENKDQKDDETRVEKQKETGLDLEKTTEIPNNAVQKILDEQVRAEN